MGSMDLFAQTRIITGTVKDSNGDAIIGASILVQGTTVGTYSDVNGGFSLAVAADAKTCSSLLRNENPGNCSGCF